VGTLEAVVPDAREDAFALLAAWESYMDVTGMATKTRESYMKGMLTLLAKLRPIRHPWEVTEDDLVVVLAAIPENGSGRGYILRPARHFYAWSARRGGPNPCDRLKIPRRKSRPVEGVLTKEELGAIVKAAADVDPRAPHAIILAYSTGARVSSLVGLRYEDCCPTKKRAVFQVAKGDKPYEVPLSAQAWGAVEALHELRDYSPRRGKRTTDNLLGVREESFRVWLRKAAEAAGIERRVWAHLLRHTFATELAAVCDPRTWQELMNHSDMSQYRRYAHPDEGRLRSAVELLEVT
jgi:site-specific recombinase XerD